MSAFKQFTTQDVTVTPFNAEKEFTFEGYQITSSNVGIDFFTGVNTPIEDFISQSSEVTGLTNEQYTKGIYNSIKHLYYSNYISSSQGDTIPEVKIIPGATSEETQTQSNIVGPRYENYLQTSITQSRFFPTSLGDEISVISIPSGLYGENIVPTTFEFTYTSSDNTFYQIKDDGEGNLVTGSDIVGQLFYSHGIATFTTDSLSNLSREINETSSQLTSCSLNFNSSIRIYEQQYRCVIRDNEFDYSYNPTLLSSSLENAYKNMVTGSNFNPYVTTIGLYNKDQDLIAIGKLSNPIPISRDYDTTFLVNFDV